jgi:Fe-S-cluster containining protein
VTELTQAIMGAAARDEVVEAIGAIYGAVNEEIDARRPVCVMSGRCCRFEDYGHRLYVTTMELAAFFRTSSAHGCLELTPTWDGRGCPFQINRLCSVHALRPFGCRVFFCDSTATQWQQDLYEQYHAQLKRLHESLNVPYFYVEWRQGLEALAAAAAPSHNPVAPVDNL